MRSSPGARGRGVPTAHPWGVGSRPRTPANVPLDMHLGHHIRKEAEPRTIPDQGRLAMLALQVTRAVYAELATAALIIAASVLIRVIAHDAVLPRRGGGEESS